MKKLSKIAVAVMACGVVGFTQAQVVGGRINRYKAN